MSIFEKRKNYKPFEYPQVYQFTEALNKSFWVHSEVDFTADTQDFKTSLSKVEQSATERALLSIAQVEVEVKAFWGDLYKMFPKPEFNGLGATFAECYVEGTEVMTLDGWKQFKDVSSKDLVATFNDNRDVVFEKPKNYISKPYSGDVYRFKSKDHHTVVTENHAMRIYKNGSSSLETILAKDLNTSNSAYRFPVSTGINGNYYDLLDDLSSLYKVFIAIQADGCLRHFRNKEGDKVLRGVERNSRHYEVTFRKEDKINRFSKLLDESTLFYTCRVNSNNTTTFDVFTPLNLDLKSFEWMKTLDLTKQLLCKSIIAELSFWDDSYLKDKKNCKIKYSTTDKNNVNIIQLIGTVAGYKTNLIVQTDKRSDTFSDVFIVSFNINRETLPVTSLTKTKENYKGLVYCLDMGNGNLITRYDNKVFFGGNCEFRHSEAYSRLLEVLGLDSKFASLMEVPVFKRKYELICSIMADSTKSYEEKLLFFTLVIENSSLFSQFGTILSLTRFKGLLKNTSNIIAWTSVDEQIHASAGVFIINEIKKEKPVFEGIDIPSAIREYVKIEEELLDWIFEEGELDFFTKEDLLNFIKYRLDNALLEIGLEKIFNITAEQYKPMAWFEEEVFSNSLDDFFAKRPVDYTKNDKTITANDLF